MSDNSFNRIAPPPNSYSGGHTPSHGKAQVQTLARDAFGREIPDQQPQPPFTTGNGSAQPAATKKETATDVLGRRAGALADELDFPAFVASLVHGTFDAIVDSSIRQMEAYANLVAAVSKPLDQFALENVTRNQARDWLVEQYPADVGLVGEGGEFMLTPVVKNEDDFNEKFKILSAFTGLDILSSYTDQDIMNTYNSYKIYFYASNTLNYENKYIGDAILLLAYDLIEKFPKEEKNILKTIKECDVGIEFHTNLSKRVFNFNSEIENKIQSLKDKLNISCNKQNFRVNNTYIMDFGEFQSNTEIKHNFEKFNIAYYTGIESCTKTQTLLESLDAKILNLDSMKSDLAMDTFHLNPDLTYKLASTIMLDAFDQNADLLVVDNDDLFYLFDYNRKELSRVSGRDILIPVIHRNELEKLSNGIHGSVKETLNKHIVNPELI